MSIAAAVRHVTRIVGLHPPYRYVAMPVTPVGRMADWIAQRASSPLDALVRYCDRHAWRIEGRTHITPTLLEATIYPCGDPATTLSVEVRAIDVEHLPLERKNDRWFGVYGITVQHPTPPPSGDLVDW